MIYFLLDLIPDLTPLIETLRIDLRFYEDFQIIKSCYQLLEKFDLNQALAIKKAWNVKTTHGFYRANKTDMSIKRLKNKHLSLENKNLVGHVLEIARDEYLAISTKQTIQVGQTLFMKNPEGKIMTIKLTWIKDTEWNSIDELVGQGVCLIPYFRGASPKTNLYFSEE